MDSESLSEQIKQQKELSNKLKKELANLDNENQEKIEILEKELDSTKNRWKILIPTFYAYEKQNPKISEKIEENRKSRIAKNTVNRKLLAVEEEIQTLINAQSSEEKDLADDETMQEFHSNIQKNETNDGKLALAQSNPIDEMIGNLDITGRSMEENMQIASDALNEVFSKEKSEEEITKEILEMREKRKEQRLSYIDKKAKELSDKLKSNIVCVDTSDEKGMKKNGEIYGEADSLYKELFDIESLIYADDQLEELEEQVMNDKNFDVKDAIEKQQKAIKERADYFRKQINEGPEELRKALDEGLSIECFLAKVVDYQVNHK